MNKICRKLSASSKLYFLNYCKDRQTTARGLNAALKVKSVAAKSFSTKNIHLKQTKI